MKSHKITVWDRMTETDKKSLLIISAIVMGMLLTIAIGIITEVVK